MRIRHVFRRRKCEGSLAFLARVSRMRVKDRNPLKFRHATMLFQHVCMHARTHESALTSPKRMYLPRTVEEEGQRVLNRGRKSWEVQNANPTCFAENGGGSARVGWPLGLWQCSKVVGHAQRGLLTQRLAHNYTKAQAYLETCVLRTCVKFMNVCHR